MACPGGYWKGTAQAQHLHSGCRFALCVAVVTDMCHIVHLQHIDGINLFGLISIASILYCAPLAIIMEGSVWSGAYNTALANVGKQELFKQMAIAGIFYHLYNQVSHHDQ